MTLSEFRVKQVFLCKYQREIFACYISHSCSYEKWSIVALKQYAHQRGLKVPHASGFELVCMLRQTDHKASISFLDFAPEIRSIIYRELVAPRSNFEAPEGFYSYPAILATCEQVYNKAFDTIYTTTSIPISMRLQTHDVDPCLNATFDYLVEVGFNGGTLYSCQRYYETMGVPWPPALTKLWSLDIRITAKDSDPPTHLYGKVAAPVQLNHACSNLFEALSNSTSLRHMDINLRNAITTGLGTAAGLYFPMTALALRPGTITWSLTTSFNQLATGIRDSIAAFERLRVLTANIKLMKERNGSLSQGLVAVMQRIDEVTTVPSAGFRGTLPGPEMLAEAIYDMEQNLAHANDKEVGSGRSSRQEVSGIEKDTETIEAKNVSKKMG
jgi:hypothetical protein